MQRSTILPGYWIGFIFISDSDQVQEGGLRMPHVRSNSLSKILNFVLLKIRQTQLLGDFFFQFSLDPILETF